jgi:NAD(P)-dependent dehydrogenase (short-subunit alcohol dehydrogenase family)
MRGRERCSYGRASPALGSGIGPQFSITIAQQPAIAGAQFKLACRPALAARPATGRVGEAEGVAKTVLFLASDDASHIQGAEIFVDGGSTGSPAGALIYRG